MQARPQISDPGALVAALLTDPELADLAEAIDLVPRAVDKIWKDNHQTWFTDHGPAHSRRVADYALRMTDLPKLHTSQRLSALEAFILWSAAWLHDIGMQDLLDTGHLGELDKAGFAEVRSLHPHRSSERILEDWGALGLPDDHVLAQTVADVARAHGTGYYRDTVTNRLADRAAVRNREVRPRLLAALLLFADELDLDYARGRDPSGWVENNAVSEAHGFKHKCVRAVRPVCENDGRIAVELQLAFPSGLNQEDALMVQRWIEVKLRRQMSLVEPELAAGMEKQARFDRHIRTSVERLRVKVPTPSAEALAVIAAETARDELINHSETFAQVQAEVGSGAIVVLGPNDPSALGWTDEGRADMLAAVCAAAAASGSIVCLSRRAAVSSGATASDVVEEWLHALGQDQTLGTGEDSRRGVGLRRLLAALVPGRRYVFAIDRADLIDADDLRWLQREVAEASRKMLQASFIITGSAETSFAASGTTTVRVSLGVTDLDDAVAYLGRFAAREVALAESRNAPSYDFLKTQAQQHELLLWDGGTDATT